MESKNSLSEQNKESRVEKNKDPLILEQKRREARRQSVLGSSSSRLDKICGVPTNTKDEKIKKEIKMPQSFQVQKEGEPSLQKQEETIYQNSSQNLSQIIKNIENYEPNFKNESLKNIDFLTKKSSKDQNNILMRTILTILIAITIKLIPQFSFITFILFINMETLFFFFNSEQKRPLLLKIVKQIWNFLVDWSILIFVQVLVTAFLRIKILY